MQAFDDAVVLDLTQHIAGPYATRLLADFGADVIKIERPGGDPARGLGPFKDGESHPEKSGLFFYLNCNKRSVVLDLKAPEGQLRLLDLAERADLVVESFKPGVLERLGLGWEVLHARRPSLPLVSVSNFGQTGPYRDFKLTDLVLYGFAGEMYSMGMTEREPVKMAGTAALFESGSAIAVACAGALAASRRHGIGQHVDVSLAETHFGGVDRRHATAIAYQFSGRKTLRTAGAGVGMPQGIYLCADGHVDFTNAGLYPDRILDMLNAPEWATDPRFLDPIQRLDAENIDEWNAHFIVWCLERTKREIWDEARRARVLCGPLFTMEDLYNDEHFRSRAFWTTTNHPVIGDVDLPGRPFLMERGGWQLRRPAPLLGQHTDEILGSVLPATGSAEGRAPRRSSDALTSIGQNRTAPEGPATSARASAPLAGIRIIDLCVVWAGPFATMLLADLGAEVIKPENPFVFQPMTRGAIARPAQVMLDRSLAWSGGFPDNVPGAHPWNHVPTFVSLYRNKKSFTVDLRRPEGMDVFRRLVEKADVVYENNATGTMEKLGITYDWLRHVKPDIIMVRVPAYGSTGPYRTARALGVHLEAVMGHTLLRGYDDADPSDNTAIYSGDYLAGAQGAFAVMAALRYRDRTGEGQLIEIAQAENAAPMFTQAIMDYTMNRRVQTTIGNRDTFGRFPCGVYTARSSGSAETMDDRWVSIHVEDDAGWAGLKRAMGEPAWAAEARFATNAGRAEHFREIDAHITVWTAKLDDYEIMHRCQQQGVAAAPVLEASRMFDDPHLRARTFFVKQRQQDAGEHEYVGPLWKFSETPVEFYQAPVMFGEHNDYVYRELLQLSEAEIAALAAAGHIATEYDSSVR